jgi:hypothetical protein
VNSISEKIEHNTQALARQPLLGRPHWILFAANEQPAKWRLLLCPPVIARIKPIVDNMQHKYALMNE